MKNVLRALVMLIFLSLLIVMPVFAEDGHLPYGIELDTKIGEFFDRGYHVERMNADVAKVTAPSKAALSDLEKDCTLYIHTGSDAVSWVLLSLKNDPGLSGDGIDTKISQMNDLCSKAWGKALEREEADLFVKKMATPMTGPEKIAAFREKRNGDILIRKYVGSKIEDIWDLTGSTEQMLWENEDIIAVTSRLEDHAELIVFNLYSLRDSAKVGERKYQH